MSQLQLAERTHLSRNYISDLELGRKSPSLCSIERLAVELRVAPSTLIRDAEDRSLDDAR
jgi:transcriptional regulator with XRE-family HTH domain